LIAAKMFRTLTHKVECLSAKSKKAGGRRKNTARSPIGQCCATFLGIFPKTAIIAWFIPVAMSTQDAGQFSGK